MDLLTRLDHERGALEREHAALLAARPARARVRSGWRASSSASGSSGSARSATLRRAQRLKRE